MLRHQTWVLGFVWGLVGSGFEFVSGCMVCREIVIEALVGIAVSGIRSGFAVAYNNSGLSDKACVPSVGMVA